MLYGTIPIKIKKQIHREKRNALLFKEYLIKAKRLLGYSINAKASKLEPHADLTAFGPAVSNFINTGLFSLNVDLWNKSLNALPILRLSVRPLNGDTIVLKSGLTLVGNIL